MQERVGGNIDGELHSVELVKRVRIRAQVHSVEDDESLVEEGAAFDGGHSKSLDDAIEIERRLLLVPRSMRRRRVGMRLLRLSQDRIAGLENVFVDAGTDVFQISLAIFSAQPLSIVE